MSMHPTRNYFAEYKQDCTVFVETGTYAGAGLNLAIEAGFSELHSIDIVNHPDKVFKYPCPAPGKMQFYIDDSREVLPWLLPMITGKCLFWLDAHSQLMEGEPDNFPLLDELAVISQHCRNDHVILIDDILMMSHVQVTGWTLNDIVLGVCRVNPLYKFDYLPNPVRKNILVAYV